MHMYVEEALAGGIIEKTIDGEACVPAHFVEKLDAAGNITGVRLVCDLKKLNCSVKRPTQCFPTGNDVWNQVDQSSKRFFRTDLTSGYHQGGQEVLQLHPSPRQVSLHLGSDGVHGQRGLVQPTD